MRINNIKEFETNYLVNDTTCVPKAADNSDYQKIQQWIKEGGIVEKEDLLAKEKSAKIAEIKSIRDQKNIEPITDYKAFLLDEEGNKTSEESYFLFYTNRHLTNPASDPSSIISRVLDLGAMPYFTKDLEDKDIAVELTPAIAKLLRQHLMQRNDNNYKISQVIKSEIQNTKTLEGAKAIMLKNAIGEIGSKKEIT